MRSLKKNTFLLNSVFGEDYELIDCGGLEKLERFGEIILIRPEPKAVWPKTLSQKEWDKRSDSRFKSHSPLSGEWTAKSGKLPKPWSISYKNKDIQIQFLLKLTAFKHVGIFPEQAVNWDYISSALASFKNKKPKVLNLFAYTGGASLVAKASGADVVHVDSIKQVITWANRNQELSGLKNIRWVVEDALKFVKREIKRGNTYNGIILDPPAYGHGPKGERWILQDQLMELMQDVITLLDPKEHFLILNTYTDAISSFELHDLISTSFKKVENLETGELFLQSLTNKKLPLGSFGRFKTS